MSLTSGGELLAAGREALALGEWEEARQRFGAALAAGSENGDALEGLGWALWWLDRPQESLAARERAYALFARAGERRRAARLATALGVDSVDLHGEAVAIGWLERARSLLEGVAPGVEHGWLALWSGQIELYYHDDAEAGAALAAEAEALGRKNGAADLELLARALDGLVQVRRGRVAEGMRRLDEALTAAMAGEMSDLDSVGATCCLLVHACEHARDYARAEQWHRRVEAFARRWRVTDLFNVCRVEHAAMRLWQGAWPQAEQELVETIAAIQATRPWVAAEAIALLGELRRRQGRTAEARELFAREERLSLSLLGCAALALDDGAVEDAAELVDRALRRLAGDNRALLAMAHELGLRAALRRGKTDAARAHAATLERLAEEVGTEPFRAAAALGAGLLAAAAGEHGLAQERLGDAVDLYARVGAPYEEARARLDLAAVWAVSGETEHAGRERATAAAALAQLREPLRAAPGTRAATATTASVPAGAATVAPGAERPPSARELEVLRLVAEGLSDREIADRLHLSEHTIHRHIANLFDKLDAPSRAAAVAKATRLGLL